MQHPYMGVKGSQKGNLDCTDRKVRQSHGMDKKEEHKTEQGEDMDTRKGHEKEESDGGGQQTLAKPPPTQPGGQEPPLHMAGEGGS
jgi:hypothetical protein